MKHTSAKKTRKNYEHISCMRFQRNPSTKFSGRLEMQRFRRQRTEDHNA